MPKSSAAWIEYGLAALVVTGAAGACVFLIRFGYLPSPFYHLKNDTFMDWYNPAFWSHRRGVYSEAGSVYPPLAFELLRLLTPGACYRISALAGRGCDISGYVTISLFVLVNLGLTWLAIRRAGRRIALPRALAVTLGASMLYGWERGNLVLPCFAVFVLSYGSLVRSPWLRALFAAVAVNLKPYLIIAPFTQALQRDWSAVLRFLVAGLAVYVASYALLGLGSPMDLVRDAWMFMRAPVDHRYGIFQFTTTYDSLLQILQYSAPLRLYLGAPAVTAARLVLPAIMGLGAAGAGLCLILGARWPEGLSPTRMAALGFSIMFIFASPGAYALIFLLVFVFLEPWRGAGRIVALIAAYVWCIPWDYNLAPILHETNFSFLAGRPVGFELSLTLGELLRPGLVLVIQFGLIAASFGDLRRYREGARPAVGLEATFARA